ncbi:hypothetical protein EV182_000821 [Spiromyces aspiralis]|uniref:Uncharacterized protein n=1 Tax=Spiromyces aspiralis TaxID=68401 RepID=A0ACC1HTW1_9FUNG|nr:hypothetical protein EV182_000821 [Spiromyces aspiralis]
MPTLPQFPARRPRPPPLSPATTNDGSGPAPNSGTFAHVAVVPTVCNEKCQLLVKNGDRPASIQPLRTPGSPWHHRRRSRIAAALGLAVLLIGGLCLLGLSSRIARGFLHTVAKASYLSTEPPFRFYGDNPFSPHRVPVDLYVMSKCPDALLVEDMFNTIVYDLAPIMDLKLHYIAQPSDNATYGVICKHGDSECRGNIDELCAYTHHRHDLKKWWGFVACLNRHQKLIGLDDHMTMACATSADLDIGAFHHCRNGPEGRELLKNSARETAREGVKISATLYLNHWLRCVEDSGWKYCPGGHTIEDFERDICALYQDPTHAPLICAQFDN